jgi:hypothetical protein
MTRPQCDTPLVWMVELMANWGEEVTLKSQRKSRMFLKAYKNMGQNLI